MSQIKIASHQEELALYQAQGQLNKEIQIALETFRKTLAITTHKDREQSYQHKYDTGKIGPQKVFQFKQSLLSLMFQIKDFKTLYNMVIASFIILTFTLIFTNYLEHGQILDHQQLSGMFYGLSRVLLYWILLATVHFTIIFIVKVALETHKIIWLPLYICHLAALLGIAMYVSSSIKLGFACVMILMAQATRMVMKSHSYFRTKILYLTENKYKNFAFKGYRVKNVRNTTLRQKENEYCQNKIIFLQVCKNDIFTQFKNLAYFFVAPTIIYRDRYVLTPVRSISKIIVNTLNFLACIYYSFILYIFMCKPAIQKLESKLDTQTFILTVIKLMLPSNFFLIMGFFGFLHSWLNCWAEITRFPDRCFYSDWWNSIQFGSYYRKWNIIVHDWLYYYIYLDTMRFLGTKSSLIPKMMTFLISAVIHELIITYALGFFYPILFILFTGPGLLLIQNQKKLKSISINLAFWLQMYIGGSLLFTCYLLESFARKNIPDSYMIQHWGSIGHYVPRTLYLGQSIKF